MKSVKPYASWPSDLSPQILANKGKRYGHLALSEGRFYWLEVRASEKGRGVLMCSDNGAKAFEVLPDSISVRTKVHEYGGADYLVVGSKVFFSNAKDNNLYCFDGSLTALTEQAERSESRYADFCFEPLSNRLIAVRERHKSGQVHNDLVSICVATKTLDVLHSGFDFYSYPRVSQAGHRLCWTCWNQPDMPWDNAELWLADYHHNGTVDAVHKVSGGNNCAIFQPTWGQDGVLHYISDSSGWSNIYNHRDGILNALTPIDRDFSVPQWIFGLATFVINNDNSLYALLFESGQQQLCHIDTSNGHIEPIDLPFKHFEGALLADQNYLYFCAASPESEAAMYRYNIKLNKTELLSGKAEFPLSKENISVAESIEFESVNGRRCYAFYYPPKNQHYQGLANTLPPLIVMSHGGPTAFSDNSLDSGIQFWTNRGFAVVDVNYAGSTGYGRKYREQLNGQWGISDVEDCVAAAQYLVSQNLVDKASLLIRGGSAGGYTTLCALTFSDVFAAGMSRYGVADLESLATDSHKFEARYLDKLVGEYPQQKATYQARSPIHHTDKLSCPILLLQGADDKVVPPNQAEMMAKALDVKKIPYAYLLFEGEGHGFRQAETIIKAFNAELSFYRQILKVESVEKQGEHLDIYHL
jgi:dipeptidyl aminopeptidase/acylaminoacyl peptidase